MSDGGIFGSRLGVTGYGPRTTADVWNVNQVNALYYSHTSTEGRQWNDNTGPQLTITYSFMGDMPGVGVMGNTNPNGVAAFDPEEYGPGSEADGFLMLNGDQREAIEAAVAAWEAVTNVDFVRNTTEPAKITTHTETSTSVGDIRFGMTNTGLSVDDAGVVNAGAHAYHPSINDLARYGDIWLYRAGFESQSIAPGTGNFETVLHEMGHAVYGLIDVTRNVGLLGSDIRGTVWDNDLWTVMSYRSTVAASNVTPMYLDIVASRGINGVFEVFNTGNNVYEVGLNGLSTIWDNGGYDEIVWTSTAAAYIDLQPGLLTAINGGLEILADDRHIGWSGRRESLGGFDENDWRFFIAPGSDIEAATGNAGNDRIQGTFLDNVLRGNGGHDTLLGFSGRDTLRGGAGFDRLDGGPQVDTADFSDLTSSVEVDLANGIATSNGDIDTLIDIENAIGTQFGDTFIGYGENNLFEGRAGDDTYVISSNNQTVTERTNEGTDTIRTSLADYTLPANVENLTGGAASNDLTGNSDNNIVDGAGGADIMRGWFGDDTYIVDNAGDQVIESPTIFTAFATLFFGTDTVRTSLANYVLPANVENLVGTSATGQTLTGNAQSNTITGGAGVDAVVFTGARANYQVTRLSPTSLRAADGRAGAPDGTDTVDGVEQFRFADRTYARSELISNQAPIVGAANVAAARGQSIAAQSLFTVGDADGDTATVYQLADGSGDLASGRWVVNGAVQSANQLIEVTADQLAQTAFQLGSGSDTLAVRAFDGAVWSDFKIFSVAAPANQRPVVTVTDVSGKTGSMLAISTAFSVADADGDTIAMYRFADGGATPGGNHVMIGAVEYPANQLITVTPDQLAETFVHATGGSERFAVQAFDGTDWSDFAVFTATAIANAKPVVAASNTTIAKGATVAAGSLFTASDADAGETITRYQFADGNADPASGHFVKGGVEQAANRLIDVAAAELAETTFQAGSGTDLLGVRAFDGNEWGDFKFFTVSAPANARPVVTASSTTVAKGADVAASSLFTASDADAGDTITKYQFADGTADPASGHFVVAGAAQAANQLIEITAAQYAATTFQTGSGADTLAVRAFDGTDWGEFTVFTVTAPANRKPVISGADPSLALGSTTPVASLFTVSDADLDTIVKYRFADGNANASSGHFVVDGLTQVANTVIEVAAGDLALASYVAAAAPGSESIAVGAFDGQAWSDWYILTATSHV